MYSTPNFYHSVFDMTLMIEPSENIGTQIKKQKKKNTEVRVRLFVVHAVQEVSVSAPDELSEVTTDPRNYKQSMELSGISPSGGAFPGGHDGGSITLGAGSTFSESSIFSELPSQLMWNRVTRGFDARMFLWS